MLILVGVGGLLGFAVWSLSTTTANTIKLARAESVRAARATAAAVRATLEREDFGARFGADHRFTITAGRLDVPEDLHHLSASEEPSPIDRLATLPRLLVGEARRAEFGERDVDAAGELWARLEASADLDESSREWVTLQRAMFERRRGREEVATDLLDQLATAPLGPAWPVVAVAVARHRVVSTGDVPDWVASRLPTWSQPRAAMLIDRLTEAAPDSPEVYVLGFDWRELVERRRRLAVVDRWLRASSLEAAATTRIARRESTWIWYRPEVDSSRGAGDAATSSFLATGHGVVLNDTELVAVIGAATGSDGSDRTPVEDWRVGEIGDRAMLAGDAIPVVPGLAIATRPPAPVGGSRAAAMLALFALALLAGLGLISWFRVLRVEQAAAQSRVDFATAVTHELKTPLASIQLYAEMLEDDRVSAEMRQRYTASLAADCQRMGILLDNVLGVDPVERGARSYDRSPVRVEALVAEAVERYRPIAERDELVIDTDLEAGDTTVTTDRTAILHVLLNLLENVRRYGFAGGRVLLRGERVDETYRLSVRDFGVGVPAAERNQIFEKFQRGSAAVGSANPGVGLGLYLCRAILRDLGGDIACVEPGGEPTNQLSGEQGTEQPGALFIVTLPAISSPRAAVEGARA